MKKLGKVQEYNITNTGAIIKTENGIANIIFMNSNIIKLRLTFNKKFDQASSFSLVKTCWEDEWEELLKNEREKIVPLIPIIQETEKILKFQTKKLKIEIQKENFSLIIKDDKDNIIHSDLLELGYIKNKNNQITHYSKLKDEDNYYGLGEKTGKLNKKGKRYRMSNFDTPSYDPINTDPLYKHIPFCIKFNKESKRAIGIFYNDSDEGIFDLGNERSGYFEKYCYYKTNSRELDIYFINGPEIKNVVKNYTWLTGTTAMPPISTLGNLASTMYFTELSKNVDKEILDYIDKLKKLDIPCDGYFLSSGYTTGKDNKRYTFTWNNEKFSDPKAFIKKMEEKGAPVVPNIKPAFLTTHPLYNNFLEKEAFLSGEEETYVGRFWGGNGSFIDFLKETGRKKWSNEMKNSLLNMGIKAIWNDNCEYELYANAYYGEEKKDAFEKRPIFPNVMAKVARENLLENYPENRPFVMNRAGFSGLQRYAQTWSGDNRSTWDNLKYNIPTMLGMGLSGVANQGSDIGGFEGEAPTPELFVRWVQHGIFQPRFTIHSQNSDNTVTTPWMYHNFTDKIRDAIKFRYTLIPYFYSLFYEANTKGSPVTRPLIYEFQNDIKVAEESFNFMLGESLLVSTIIEEKQKIKSIYLPKDYKWYDYYTKKEYEGGQEIILDVDLDTVPLYIREGSIIPTTKEISSLNLQEINYQKLLITPAKDSLFNIYEDDGKTNEYKEGNFNITTVTTKNKNKKLQINFEKNGTYISKIEKMELEIILKEAAPVTVCLNNKYIDQVLSREDYKTNEMVYYYDVETRCVNIKYKNIYSDYKVILDFSEKDMTGIMEN